MGAAVFCFAFFSKPYSFFGSRLNGRVTVAYFQREHLYAEIIRDG